MKTYVHTYMNISCIQRVREYAMNFRNSGEYKLYIPNYTLMLVVCFSLLIANSSL